MWITSLSSGMATALAASMTLATSFVVTSRFFIAITPWELIPLICPPDIPAKTLSDRRPAISSASSIAFFMLETVRSMLTTTPRRKPRDGDVPTPMMSTTPSAFNSPMMAQIFVVPTSRPQTILSLLDIFYPCRSGSSEDRTIARSSKSRFIMCALRH